MSLLSSSSSAAAAAEGSDIALSWTCSSRESRCPCRCPRHCRRQGQGRRRGRRRRRRIILRQWRLVDDGCDCGACEEQDEDEYRKDVLIGEGIRAVASSAAAASPPAGGEESTKSCECTTTISALRYALVATILLPATFWRGGIEPFVPPRLSSSSPSSLLSSSSLWPLCVGDIFRRVIPVSMGVHRLEKKKEREEDDDVEEEEEEEEEEAAAESLWLLNKWSKDAKRKEQEEETHCPNDSARRQLERNHNEYGNGIFDKSDNDTDESDDRDGEYIGMDRDQDEGKIPQNGRDHHLHRHHHNHHSHQRGGAKIDVINHAVTANVADPVDTTRHRHHVGRHHGANGDGGAFVNSSSSSTAAAEEEIIDNDGKKSGTTLRGGGSGADRSDKDNQNDDGDGDGNGKNDVRYGIHDSQQLQRPLTNKQLTVKPPGDYSQFSCDSLYQKTVASTPSPTFSSSSLPSSSSSVLPETARCDFARTCNGGDGIYAPITYCSKSYSPRTIVLCLCLPLILWLTILFKTLGSTAEEFFSPGLEMFSLRMGLPERFAGVTLLALGNGAPDVASIVNAILDDPNRGYLLAVGELTGSAMVIGTIVAGAVVYVASSSSSSSSAAATATATAIAPHYNLATNVQNTRVETKHDTCQLENNVNRTTITKGRNNNVQFGGALIRDVCVFVLTVAICFGCLQDQSVSIGEVRIFGAMYASYVLVVLMADMYHRKVVEPRENQERLRAKRRRRRRRRLRRVRSKCNDSARSSSTTTTTTTKKKKKKKRSIQSLRRVEGNEKDVNVDETTSETCEEMIRLEVLEVDADAEVEAEARTGANKIKGKIVVVVNDDDDDDEGDDDEEEEEEEEDDGANENTKLISAQPYSSSSRSSDQNVQAKRRRAQHPSLSTLTLHPHPQRGKLEKVLEAISNYDENSREDEAEEEDGGNDDDDDDNDDDDDDDDDEYDNEIDEEGHGAPANGRAATERAGDAISYGALGGGYRDDGDDDDDDDENASSLPSRRSAPPPPPPLMLASSEPRSSNGYCRSHDHGRHGNMQCGNDRGGGGNGGGGGGGGGEVVIAATASGWPKKSSPSWDRDPLVVFHPHHYHPCRGGVMDIAHPPPHPIHFRSHTTTTTTKTRTTSSLSLPSPSSSSSAHRCGRQLHRGATKPHPAPSPTTTAAAETSTLSKLSSSSSSSSSLFLDRVRSLGEGGNCGGNNDYDDDDDDDDNDYRNKDGRCICSHQLVGESASSWGDAMSGCWEEFIEHWSEFWAEIYHCDENGPLEKALLTFELPFTVLRKLTIPIPCDGYYSRPLVALSTALSPLWIAFYLWTQFDVDLMDISSNAASSKRYAVVLLFVLLALAGLLVARYAPSGDVPMRTSVSVPITLWGFLISATWLDLIADQLVGLLSYFGIVCRIPPTIMGLTVLAWGNSLQDMLANITVARKGLSNMAITACFAGPIFNMLVGLGIGFSALLNMTGRTSFPVELTPPLRMGFLFSILNGVVIIVLGVALGRRTIPRQYGYVALALYGAYVIASLAL